MFVFRKRSKRWAKRGSRRIRDLGDRLQLACHISAKEGGKFLLGRQLARGGGSGNC
jgi:hypothetical protein